MLINFTSGVFKSEKEMELYKFRWNEARSKYLADLQANGLIRWASMQIWNKQGKSQLGWLFEYSDPDAYKKCQPIFKQMEADFGDIEMPTNYISGRCFRRAHLKRLKASYMKCFRTTQRHSYRQGKLGHKQQQE